MEVSSISHDDALRAGQLAHFLKDGRWNMTAEQAATFSAVIRWYHSICGKIAEKVPPGKETKAEGPPPAGTFKVKSITPGKQGEPTKVQTHTRSGTKRTPKGK